MSSISDNGHAVVVDLHGLSVAEAIATANAVLALAHERGRSTVRFIHGSSTTDFDERNRTIKTELRALISSGHRNVSGFLADDDSILVSIPLSEAINPERIRRLDIH